MLKFVEYSDLHKLPRFYTIKFFLSETARPHDPCASEALPSRGAMPDRPCRKAAGLANVRAVGGAAVDSVSASAVAQEDHNAPRRAGELSMLCTSAIRG